jgi:hypothetical protein
MHDVLRRRLLRRIESLPEAQVYQVLDFVEFLESKYARDARVEPTVLQKFAEGVEDKLRNKAMNPATLREAFQLIAAADRVLADVTDAGKQILGELSGDPPPRRDLPTPDRSENSGETGTRRTPPGSRGGGGSRGPRESGSGNPTRGPRPYRGDGPEDSRDGERGGRDGPEGSSGS